MFESNYWSSDYWKVIVDNYWRCDRTLGRWFKSMLKWWLLKGNLCQCWSSDYWKVTINSYWRHDYLKMILVNVRWSIILDNNYCSSDRTLGRYWECWIYPTNPFFTIVSKKKYQAVGPLFFQILDSVMHNVSHVSEWILEAVRY